LRRLPVGLLRVPPQVSSPLRSALLLLDVPPSTLGTFVTTITYYTLTCLHWLTSQLSITFSNYHRLYIFTLPASVSYRDLNYLTTDS
jgi:hypothetical protein